MLAATAELYDVDVATLTGHQGLARMIAPAEVAAVIAHACSLAGAVLNGSDVHADGGFRA